MKKIIAYAVIAIASILVVSFIQWDLRVWQWDSFYRLLVIPFAALGSFLYAMWTDKKLN